MQIIGMCLLTLLSSDSANGFLVGLTTVSPTLNGVSFRSPAIEMGRGDKRTKKGKRKAGAV